MYRITNLYNMMKYLLYVLNITICFAGCCAKNGDNNNSFKVNKSGCCNGGCCKKTTH